MEVSEQTIFRICMLAFLGILSGCVPAPLGKYYKPIYSDTSASYSGDQCGGKAGAPAALTITLPDGVLLNINAWRTYGEQNRKDLPLNINIQVPKGIQTQFVSNEIRVSSNAYDDGQIIPAQIGIVASVMVQSDEVVDMQKIAPTPFPSRDDPQVATKFMASTGLNFSWADSFIPSEVSMDIPPIVVLDDTSTVLSPTKLLAKAKKRPDTYPGQYKSNSSLIYVTQESELALSQKYSRCIQSASNRNCDRILQYDEGRFNFDLNQFGISGRLYVFDVEKRSPFSGELNIKYQVPTKWKFGSNKIVIADRSSMEKRVFQFTQFLLSFGYQVPLNAPVRGVNDSPYGGSTKITISSSLGTEDLPKYFVKLPPMLINGKQYQIKPIELERRVLDFGIQPFNC